ncbi:MAG: GNAT family N-acetyltransferase [Actinomycetota bacterium]|nr:GNAT family N-acetyltransferase [Actinomycetota bacterium]
MGNDGAATVFRPLRENDADAVVAVYDAAFGEQRPIDAGEIVGWFRNSELKSDWLRVVEVNDRVVGYGDILVTGDAVAVEVAAPGHWDVFLDWAEETARAEDVPRVRVFFPAGHELAQVLASRGYHYWRSAYTMQVEFGAEAPEVPTPPAGIDLRSYEDTDAEVVRNALNEAFVDDPFHQEATPEKFRAFYLDARGFDPSLWLLAWDADELAGFVLAFPQRLGDSDLGGIEVLGVRPAWRRRGLGRLLLSAAFSRLHALGLRRVGLGVDAGNESGALQLYEGVGMRVVRQGDNWVLDV